jgi:hypothetical protein
MVDAQDIKVVIRSPDGLYVSGNPREWGLVEERCRAIIFDYHGHQVEQQIEMIRRLYGLVLEAEELAPQEIYETCDLCGQMALPSRMFFDGTQFLCPRCRPALSVKAGSTEPPSASTRR